MSGHIRKRGNTWTIYYTAGQSADGERQQRNKGGFKTKGEAQAALDEVFYGQRTGSYVEPSELTVATFLRDWLDTQESRLSGTTFEGYQIICEVHLIPELGHNLLQQLTAIQVEKYYGTKRKGDRPLSERTLLHHHRVLKKALSRAVQLQYLVQNPVDRAESPKPQKAEMHALDPEQTRRFLLLFEGTRWWIIALTAVSTGLRRGEILALTWKDVDDGYLFVRHSLEQTKGRLRVKEPKTKTSRRKITLPAFLTPALKKHKLQQAELRLKMGQGYQDNGLIFPDLKGGWMSPQALTQATRSRVKGTEFEGVGLHDLRHTHASQLLLMGTHPKVVSERLGHSNIAITLDTYSHLLPGIDEEAANKIDELLGSTLSFKN